MQRRSAGLPCTVVKRLTKDRQRARTVPVRQGLACGGPSFSSLASTPLSTPESRRAVVDPRLIPAFLTGKVNRRRGGKKWVGAVAQQPEHTGSSHIAAVTRGPFALLMTASITSTASQGSLESGEAGTEPGHSVLLPFQARPVLIYSRRETGCCSPRAYHTRYHGTHVGHAKTRNSCASALHCTKACPRQGRSARPSRSEMQQDPLGCGTILQLLAYRSTSKHRHARTRAEVPFDRPTIRLLPLGLVSPGLACSSLLCSALLCTAALRFCKLTSAASWVPRRGRVSTHVCMYLLSAAVGPALPVQSWACAMQPSKVGVPLPAPRPYSRSPPAALRSPMGA